MIAERQRTPAEFAMTFDWGRRLDSNVRASLNCGRYWHNWSSHEPGRHHISLIGGMLTVHATATALAITPLRVHRVSAHAVT